MSVATAVVEFVERGFSLLERRDARAQAATSALPLLFSIASVSGNVTPPFAPRRFGGIEGELSGLDRPPVLRGGEVLLLDVRDPDSAG